MKAAAVIALWLLACSPSRITCHEAGEARNLPCPNHLCAKLVVDEAFSLTERQAITWAAEQWRIRTDGKVAVTLTVGPARREWSVVRADLDVPLGVTNIASHRIEIDMDALGGDTKLMRQVPLHEFGHLFGLAHSDDPTSLMFSKPAADRITDRDLKVFRSMYSK